jgi:hypothetical protein
MTEIRFRAMGARRPVKPKIRAPATRPPARRGVAPAAFAGCWGARPVASGDRPAWSAIRPPPMGAPRGGPAPAALLRRATRAEGVSTAPVSATEPAVPAAAARTERAWPGIRPTRAAREALPARPARPGAARMASATLAGRRPVPMAVVRVPRVTRDRCPPAVSEAPLVSAATPTWWTPAPSTASASAAASPPVTPVSAAWLACACVTRPRVRRGAAKATLAARRHWRRAE